MLYIYCNIYHQYTPVMLAYIPAPWIRHGYGKVRRISPTKTQFFGHEHQSIWVSKIITTSRRDSRPSPGNHGLFEGNHPQMTLIQVSEILQFTQINPLIGFTMIYNL